MTEAASKIAPWRVAGIFAGLATAGVGQWYVAQQINWPVSTTALVLGSLLVAILLGPPEPTASPALIYPAPEKWGARRIFGLLLACVSAAAYVYACYWLFRSWNLEFLWAAPLAAGSIFSCSWGLALLDRPWRLPHQRPQISRTEVLAVCAIVAFGFFLRFYRFDYFPPADGFFAIEEPQSGMGAWDIVMNNARPWEFMLDRWMPVPFFKWMGPTTEALRIPFMIVSGLTVLATYFIARQVVSWPAAAFGTLLLAMARWHLNYARNAHAVFPTTLIVVILWALCVRQSKRGGLALYPLIGFWTGYTLYAYAGYRATGLVVGIFLASRFLVAVRRWWNATADEERVVARRHVVIQAMGMTIAAAALSGPLVILVDRLRSNPAYFMEAYQRSYLNKGYYTSEWSSWLRLRWERQIETAKIFNHVGDSIQSYNLPLEPMLDPITGVLFTIAIFYCVLWWRHRLQGYFAFTFLLLLIAGSTLTQTLVVCRLQVIVPLLFVLIAFATDRFDAVARSIFGKVAVWVLPLLALVVGGAAFASNYDAFFNRTITSRAVRDVFRNAYTSGIAYYNAMPDNSYMLAVSDISNLMLPNDFAWWRTTRNAGVVTTDVVPLLAGADKRADGHELHVLIQKPFEIEQLESLLQEKIPGAQCRMVRHPEGLPHLDYAACVVHSLPPAQAPTSGLKALYFRNNEPVPFLSRLEPAMSWAFVPDKCMWIGSVGAYNCRVEWDGTFTLNETGSYEFFAESRQAEFAWTLDGHAYDGAITLTAGAHTITAKARFLAAADVGARLFIRPAGTSDWSFLRFDKPTVLKLPAAS